MTLKEIERLVGLTKQDTEEAWRAADILDKNNQFRDWLIQELNILNATILGWKVVEKLFEEKVKELEIDKTKLIHLHEVIMEREGKDKVRVKEVNQEVPKSNRR